MTLPEVIGALASELPDPGSPSFVTYCAGFGGFLGGLAGRARRRSNEQISPMVADGIFWGFGVGFACWLGAIAIDRL